MYNYDRVSIFANHEYEFVVYENVHSYTGCEDRRMNRCYNARSRQMNRDKSSTRSGNISKNTM